MLDQTLVIDAGAVTRGLELDAQAKLEACLISHAHMDHVRDLATLADNRCQLGCKPLVIAATDSHEVNAQIAVDANSRGKLVNITDSPDEGNFHTMALHRSGDVTIAVSSGGVPGAAARIRDAIAERFDGRYERAVSALRGLRSRLIATGDDKWRAAAPQLLGDDFCSSVEDGTLADKVNSCR